MSTLGRFVCAFFAEFFAFELELAQPTAKLKIKAVPVATILSRLNFLFEQKKDVIDFIKNLRKKD